EVRPCAVSSINDLQELRAAVLRTDGPTHLVSGDLRWGPNLRPKSTAAKALKPSGNDARPRRAADSRIIRGRVPNSIMPPPMPSSQTATTIARDAEARSWYRGREVRLG